MTGLLAPVWAGTPAAATTSDEAWLQAMLDAEAALARAQAKLGTVPAEAAEEITAAARAERLDLAAIALGARETANPVVGLVHALSDVVGPRARDFVHRGSTSQDILDTGAMLVCARVLRLVRADLSSVAASLSRLATEHRDTPMIGRTLALHAVPTTFGLKAAGWRQLVLDAQSRVDRLLDGGLPVSLGGAAGTLAGYLEYARLDGITDESYVDKLVDAYATETGLSRPVLPWHALRTPIADVAAACACTAGALGKLAVDVQVLVRTEIGEVAEPAVAGRGGSSAMPHKRNPVLATMIRSAALQVPALAAGLTQCLLGEDERSAGAWHAEWPLLRECLRLTGGATHTAVELATGLTVHTERMRENLDRTGGQVVTERVAAVLAPRVGKAAAKRLVTEAVLEAERTGRPLADVLATHLPDEDLTTLCDPTTYTGAAAHLVNRALS